MSASLTPEVWLGMKSPPTTPASSRLEPLGFTLPTLDFTLRCLDFLPLVLQFYLWSLDLPFGPWILPFDAWTYPSVLGFQFSHWVLPFGPWILVLGFTVLLCSLADGGITPCTNTTGRLGSFVCVVPTHANPALSCAPLRIARCATSRGESFDNLDNQAHARVTFNITSRQDRRTKVH